MGIFLNYKVMQCERDIFYMRNLAYLFFLSHLYICNTLALIICLILKEHFFHILPQHHSRWYEKETFVAYFFDTIEVQIRLTAKQRADLVVYLGVVLPPIRQILDTNNIHNTIFVIMLLL